MDQKSGLNSTVWLLVELTLIQVFFPDFWQSEENLGQLHSSG